MTFDELKKHHHENNISFRYFTTELTRESRDILCNELGEVYRKMKTGCWKKVENKMNHKKGYNVILVGKKQYMRSKIVALAFGKVSEKYAHDKYINICHVNQDRLDCKITNLVVKTRITEH